MKITAFLTMRWAHYLLLASIGLFSACSSLPDFGFGKDDKDEQKVAKADSQKPLPGLEVPPDLTRPNANDTYLPPQQQAGAVQQARVQREMQSQVDGRVAPRWQGVQRMRDGQLHWLQVNATPEQTWPLVTDFLKQRGYRIARSEPAIGIMETDWKAQQADGNNTVRSQVHVRVESTPVPGRSEVFLSYKISNAMGRGGLYGPEAVDSDRTIEMQNRLAQYLGANKIDDSVPPPPPTAADRSALREQDKERERQETEEKWEKIRENCAICPPR